MVPTIRRKANDEILEEEEEPTYFECYEFNFKLPSKFDDGLCEHCRKYLTVECHHIDDFLEDEDLEEEY